MNEPTLDHGGHTQGRDRSTSAPAHVGGESVARPSHLPGLAVVDAGLRLEAEPEMTAAGGAAVFEFRIIGPTDRPITDFDELHDRRMHLIVVRRDLTGFQHLHPVMSGDGTWGTSLTLPTGGAWRAFADFATGGTAVTLGVDMLVEGAFRPEPLPPPAPTAEANGDIVSLDIATGGGLHRFTVTSNGERVQVDRYLGARGHLVVLRWGDLAFLHVHPVTDGADDIVFEVIYPSDGNYRLFLQYSVGGEVRTAAFTTSVASGGRRSPTGST